MTAIRPTVLIVDDHPIFRMGLAAALRTRGFVDVVESNGDDGPSVLLQRCSKDAPWVALLDVRLGGRDGITLCRELMAAATPPIAIMLSTFQEPAIVDAARRAGAYAYMSKEASAAEIVATIEAGLCGNDTRIRPQDVPSLTPREALVLRHLAAGASNKEIAAALGIAVDTVKDHLERLYGKLEVTDRLLAVRRAEELGLLAFLPNDLG